MCFLGAPVVDPTAAEEVAGFVLLDEEAPPPRVVVVGPLPWLVLTVAVELEGAGVKVATAEEGEMVPEIANIFRIKYLKD